MEARLDEQVKANVKLQNSLNETARKNILNNVSEGLADTQKEKLAALAEGLEFVSEESFSKKVTTIKEAYFKETCLHLKVRLQMKLQLKEHQMLM